MNQVTCNKVFFPTKDTQKFFHIVLTKGLENVMGCLLFFLKIELNPQKFIDMGEFNCMLYG